MFRKAAHAVKILRGPAGRGSAGRAPPPALTRADGGALLVIRTPVPGERLLRQGLFVTMGFYRGGSRRRPAGRNAGAQSAV